MISSNEIVNNDINKGSEASIKALKANVVVNNNNNNNEVTNNGKQDSDFNCSRKYPIEKLRIKDTILLPSDVDPSRKEVTRRQL